MSDIARFGLPLAALIAAGAMCLFLAFAPTSHAPSGDRVTGHVRVNEVATVPYTPAQEVITTHA